MSMVVIQNVSVIPMNKKIMLKNRDVIIENGKIRKIVKTGKAYDNARIVKGRGRFLMPGLFDSHVHFHDRNQFELLFLLNGVTAVRDVGNYYPKIFKMKKAAERGTLSPRIFACGQILEGDPPIWGYIFSRVIRNTSDITRAIKQFKKAGADQIKVYETLPRKFYLMAIRAAHKNGLKVTGHVSTQMSATEAVKAGLDCIEHATSVMSRELDVKSFLRFASKHRIVMCPTLVVYKKGLSLRNYKSLLKDKRLRYIKPNIYRKIWHPLNQQRWYFSSRYTNERYLEDASYIARSINRSGTLLLGTDTANPFVLPGFSIHEELELLVEAGLSPYDALRSGTVNPARFLGAKNLGTIKEGKTANLVLLNANPLKDIRNSKEINAVFLNGRVLYKKDLVKRLKTYS